MKRNKKRRQKARRNPTPQAPSRLILQESDTVRVYREWNERFWAFHLSGLLILGLSLPALHTFANGDYKQFVRRISPRWWWFIFGTLIITGIGRLYLAPRTLTYKHRLLHEPGFARKYILTQMVLSLPWTALPIILVVYFSGVGGAIVGYVRKAPLQWNILTMIPDGVLNAMASILVWILAGIIGNTAYACVKSLYVKRIRKL